MQAGNVEDELIDSKLCLPNKQYSPNRQDYTVCLHTEKSWHYYVLTLNSVQIVATKHHNFEKSNAGQSYIQYTFPRGTVADI